MSQKIFNISLGFDAGALLCLRSLLRSWRLPFEKGISAARASSLLSFNSGLCPDPSSSEGRKAGVAAFLLGRIIREVSVKELSRHILAGVVMPAAVFHGLLDRYFRSFSSRYVVHQMMLLSFYKLEEFLASPGMIHGWDIGLLGMGFLIIIIEVF